MRILVLIVGVMVLAAPLSAQLDTSQKEGEPLRSNKLDVEALRKLGIFGQSFRALDWEQEYQYIHESLENIWRQNDWTDEADLFAKDTAIAVSQIPPWKPLDRINYIVDQFAKRYDASNAQKLRVSLLLVTEASGLFLRHGETITKHATEYFELRQAGKPLTARDVARWTREGQPVLDDLHETSDRIFEKVRGQLTPQQQQILERDFRSYAKRRDIVVKMMEQWIDGRWEPEDWGMPNDQTQPAAVADKDDNPTLVPSPPEKPSPVAPPMPSVAPTIIRIQCDEFEPASWGACAAEIVEKYRLVAGQRTTADSIVAELSGRAADYCKRSAERLNKIPRAEWNTNPEMAPIRRAYAEMQERLEAIPTTAQRVRAEEAGSNELSTARPIDD